GTVPTARRRSRTSARAFAWMRFMSVPFLPVPPSPDARHEAVAHSPPVVTIAGKIAGGLGPQGQAAPAALLRPGGNGITTRRAGSSRLRDGGLIREWLPRNGPRPPAVSAGYCGSHPTTPEHGAASASARTAPENSSVSAK